ncbi:hypothetical protein EJ08DRAFT_587854 [Tothia fuscella]|uniref:Amine oxidase domain-containing protein n=1 Tax=Tothia fuscella TaxID=1048955 RepID=A0A9P4NTS1_9PEZI|nr:hypothetical protein EJ08DRAFT_587854 [Tothia fuscella]
MDGKRQVRVAVVGSGLAGLCTAFLLHQDSEKRYSVTLFEEGKELSLDSASVSIANRSTRSFDRIDLPMRAFAGDYYNNLRALYDHLGVQYRPQSFLFAFERLAMGRAIPYFIHSSNHHRIPPLKPKGVSFLAYILEFLYLSVWYSYFTLCCIFDPPRSIPASETLEDYLKRICIPQYFTTYYILPMMSSVSTCPHDMLLRFPASDIIDYKRRTIGSKHYTVANGVGDAQQRLVQDIRTISSAHVQSVAPQDDGGVKLEWRHTDDTHCLNPSDEEFHHVVLAVSPDIVGNIFQRLEGEMVQIPTIRVESTVHSDDSTIQDQPESLLSPAGNAQTIFFRTSVHERRTESVHLQPSGAIVTTCPFTPITSDRIIQTSSFTRVLRTPRSRSIVNTIFKERGESTPDKQELLVDEKTYLIAPWRNGDAGVWLAGGWCWDGMVLLEGCVLSAMRIADAFNVQIPWEE